MSFVYEKHTFFSALDYSRAFGHRKSPPKFYQNYGGLMADRVGFEPTSRLRDYLISSQGRYDHFDTCPYF